MSATTRPKKPRARWGLRILIVVSAVLVIAAGIQVISWRPAPPARVVARAQLELVDGTLREKGKSGPFTGIMIERYEDGALKSRSAVRDGRLHGLSEGWHTNGQLQVVEHFTSGVSHGLRAKWHANGRKLSEVPIIQGKLHGAFKRWAEDGTLAEVIEMKEGEPHGLSRAYYPSGCVKAEVTLSSGRVLQSRYWQDGEYKPSGRLARNDVLP